MNWHLILPNPSVMASLLARNPSYYFFHWWSTLSVSLCACAISFVVALVLAVAGLRAPIVSRIASPVATLTQSFPLQAIAPLIIIAIGIGFHAKLAIASLIAVFPIYLSMESAFRLTPRVQMARLRSTRAPFWTGVIFVRLPFAVPAILTAMKVGFTLAAIGAVIAEFIQPDSGLGRVILSAQSQYNINIIYLCVLFLIIQGQAVFLLLNYLERRIMRARATEIA